MPQPGREPPALTLEVRRDIGGNHRCFYQEGTDTAHRVGQCATFGSDAWPAGTHQDGSGKVFLERRRALLQAVATLVQAMARQVQGKNGFATVQAQVYAQVRVELVDRGALAAGSTQLVDDRILDFQGAEMGVVDARTMATELHGQGSIGQQVILPVYIVHAIVKVFGVFHGKALEHQQHAIAQA
ncbi:hypothetical protein D9M71_516430 [compost metagenome]